MDRLMDQLSLRHEIGVVLHLDAVGEEPELTMAHMVVVDVGAGGEREFQIHDNLIFYFMGAPAPRQWARTGRAFQGSAIAAVLASFGLAATPSPFQSLALGGTVSNEFSNISTSRLSFLIQEYRVGTEIPVSSVIVEISGPSVIS
jgi:hypothetical protein